MHVPTRFACKSSGCRGYGNLSAGGGRGGGRKGFSKEDQDMSHSSFKTHHFLGRVDVGGYSLART